MRNSVHLVNVVMWSVHNSIRPSTVHQHWWQGQQRAMANGRASGIDCQGFESQFCRFLMACGDTARLCALFPHRQMRMSAAEVACLGTAQIPAAYTRRTGSTSFLTVSSAVPTSTIANCLPSTCSAAWEAGISSLQWQRIAKSQLCQLLS